MTRFVNLFPLWLTLGAALALVEPGLFRRWRGASRGS
jgi:hypothetical protein